MSDSIIFPRSSKDEIDGLPYFLRMCHKVRLHVAGELHQDYHKNLGKALDLYTCQLLKIEYADLVEFISQKNVDDQAVLDWAYSTGEKPESPQKDWWCSFARNLGFRDHLSERLADRKQTAGLAHRDDIRTFFDFMDAEEGR
ncbi:MAG: DUF5069 domain-containing protein [Rubritalea sp.]|uniref:DUF5069 domain-containing protein n=1 Tax=Rubritalea sp. TaxID=2109375 RepID=UPI0032427ABD